MSEIDLVPSSYRQFLRIRRWIRNFGFIYGVLIAAIVASKVLLSFGIDAEASAIERLKADKRLVLNKKTKSDQLQEDRSTLEKRLAVLNTLRGGPPVRDVFLSIDRAMHEDVWFLDWKFMRAGEFVEGKSKSVNTGYFIVVPEDGSGSKERAWRVQTHMEIKAQALDHSSLADFVRRLSEQRVFDDVKVLTTRVHRYPAAQVVDFELAVIVGGQREAS